MTTAPIADRSALASGRWTVDPAHTTLEFRVRHAGVARVRGVFVDFDGALDVTPGEPARARATIRTGSLSTGIKARDEHLRSPDFFDAEGHPEMTFESTEIVAGDDGSLTVRGVLTIRGVTREIELDGEIGGYGRDDEGAERLGVELAGRLDRRDFGLTWNAAVDGGGLLVANRVDLSLEISAVRA